MVFTLEFFRNEYFRRFFRRNGTQDRSVLPVREDPSTGSTTKIAERRRFERTLSERWLLGIKMAHNPELLQNIMQVIDFDIRPALNMDGGDITVVSLEGNVLSVKLQGACSCCPRASDTLKHGVEKTLREKVSEDIIIRAI
jgi:Fe-S cluster biogenesis protein NfuA